MAISSPPGKSLIIFRALSVIRLTRLGIAVAASASQLTLSAGRALWESRVVRVALVVIWAGACETAPPPEYVQLPPSSEKVASVNSVPAQRIPAAQSSVRPPGPIRAGTAQTVAGTGVFTAPPETVTAVAPRTGGNDITFNFVNADVRDVLRELLGDQLHLEFAVDPKVQATVTAQTGAPIPQSAVLPTVESVLRASGVALVQSGSGYRAVPIEDASRQSPASLARAGGARPGFGIRVLPLKFIRAADLKPILDPFTPAGGVLEADNARNLLIVSGSSGDLDGFAQLARQFDVDWLSSKSFGVYPLHVGKVKDVIVALQAILDQGADGSGPLAGLVRVVPVERLNAVLAITSRPSYLAQMKSWVERLDYGDADATPRFFKYQVQRTRAADLARVLRQLFSTGEVKIVSPEKSPLPNFTRLATAVSTQGTSGSVPSAIPGVPGSGPLPAPVPALQTPADEQQQSGGAGAAPIVPGEGANQLELPPVRIVADEKNNTLVIFARPRDYRMIEGMLQQLDVEPRQVLIEATVAELTLNDQLQYGVQYFLKAGAQRFEFSTSKTGTLAPADIAGLFPGFNYIVATATQQGILSLLKSITTVTVLSSPQLLVRDHQTAGLQVGAQVPIVIQSSQSTISPNAPVINSVEYRNTGVILEVTPRINPDGMITIDVDQEVSDVAQTTSSNIDSPTINDRHLVSSIQVQDGETIALGGLIRDDTNDTKGGIPVLSEIPLLGPVFRSTSRSKGRTELLVLLSPRLIKDTKDARAMTEDLRERIQGLKPLEGRSR